MFCGLDDLPPRVRGEVKAFAEDVFGTASLSAIQCAPNSQEPQGVEWSTPSGSAAHRSTHEPVPKIHVRVFNQKELFERVSPGRDAPEVASESIMQLVDESVGLSEPDVQAGGWWDRYRQAQKRWADATSERERVKRSAGQLQGAQAQLDEINRQIAALEADDTKARRAQNAQLAREQLFLKRYVADSESWLERVDHAAQHAQPGFSEDISDPGFQELHQQLATMRREWLHSVSELVKDGKVRLWQHERLVEDSDWAARVKQAESDDHALTEELRRAGVDPAAYDELKKRRENQEATIAALEADRTSLPLAQATVNLAWTELDTLLDGRRTSRLALLNEIEDRSKSLRFTIRASAAEATWVSAVRDLAGLRVDGYLADVPTTASWLWGQSDVSAGADRQELWRDALAGGTVANDLRGKVQVNTKWLEKLDGLDESIRLVIASAVPNDIVAMRFLSGEAWQDVLTGSPGQRTAAMLAFVLNHGDEPLVLDQPEDDLDAEFISKFLLPQLRGSRWRRQIIVATHHANIPVNGDAERVIVLENPAGLFRIRASDGEPHVGAIEKQTVRHDIQDIMEGGVRAFVNRERKYNNEIRHLNVTRRLVRTL